MHLRGSASTNLLTIHFAKFNSESKIRLFSSEFADVEDCCGLYSWHMRWEHGCTHSWSYWNKLTIPHGTHLLFILLHCDYMRGYFVLHAKNICIPPTPISKFLISISKLNFDTEVCVSSRYQRQLDLRYWRQIPRYRRYRRNFDTKTYRYRRSKTLISKFNIEVHLYWS